MRMSRGSGIAGLAAMARQSQREGVVLARPLLEIPKARLLATLKKAGIDFADDPTNRDSAFTRPRFRALMPALAAEGFDARNLTRLAARFARANAALEILAGGAERYLKLGERDPDHAGFDANAFAALAEEIRLRMLLRSGRDVLVHCRGGLGRAGTIAARLLIDLGMEPATAIRQVRAVRPGAIETLEQEKNVLGIRTRV